MSTTTATPAVPFGVRHLVLPAPTNTEAPVITYSDALQLNVSAEGNPWHAITAEMPETQTETSNGDGSGPGSDSGTDLY
ncbi:putative ATP-grasp-modified RiPP [Streptomyces celluloflavus]|uniref:putative ATP-grasp-modified RiPP n=1 Tax=Streptomyces celluloflavus TaxID=58344 RepID=UPI003692308A